MVRPAPLAQSAEHSHGKAGVGGSIPPGGSRSRRLPACRGGVAQGQSKRLIIAVSVVRVHPPLPGEVCGAPATTAGYGAAVPGAGRTPSSEGDSRAGTPSLSGLERESSRTPQARVAWALRAPPSTGGTSEADEAARPVRPGRRRAAVRAPAGPASPASAEVRHGRQPEPLRRLSVVPAPPGGVSPSRRVAKAAKGETGNHGEEEV